MCYTVCILWNGDIIICLFISRRYFSKEDIGVEILLLIIIKLCAKFIHLYVNTKFLCDRIEFAVIDTMSTRYFTSYPDLLLKKEVRALYAKRDIY
ncbi:hypothetical protein C2G38_1392298 [Gigaspora rosea]|uniref:Uncharacterized protein n=1 Tax=Gigaspora rosea TaxID=44941 RepID=A0A397V9A4_9GLOM|nr:hypothetical protein C2G38_1392298 [Gigaspora rosea]